MPKKSELKEEILEILRSLPKRPGYPIRAYWMDAEEIIQQIKRHRVEKALKELEAEGIVEWDEEAQGWAIIQKEKGGSGA